MDEHAATAATAATATRKQVVHSCNNATLDKYTHKNAFIILSAKCSILHKQHKEDEKHV